MNKVLIYITICCLTGVFTCCAQTSSGNNLDENKNTVKINRFDETLKAYLDSSTIEMEDSLKKSYKYFLPALGQITINQTNIEDTVFFIDLKKYFTNKFLYDMYNDALIKYNDVSAFENELTNANNLIIQKFEKKKLPDIGMHISGFRENIIVIDNYISISIDKYLGRDYILYKDFFEEYQRINMRQEMVSRDILKAWIISELMSQNNKTLLDAMIYEGKILYILSELLPEKSNLDLIGYTAEQNSWCKEQEVKIWKSIIEKNLLFNTNYLLISKFTTDAPYTEPLSPDSPGKIGSWIGWQIVRQYAKNTNKSLSDIVNIDSDIILKDSKYNPK